MRKHLRSRNVVFFAAAGLIAALFWGGAAQAVTDTIFKYSTAKNGFYSIHPMAMAVDDSSRDYVNNHSYGQLSTTTTACFSTGVNLPQGATITAVAAWYVSAGSALTYVYRNNLSTGATDTILYGQDHDNSQTRKPVNYPVTSFNVVDNARYSYGFGTCIFGANERFTDARIAYTYTTAGD